MSRVQHTARGPVMTIAREEFYGLIEKMKLKAIAVELELVEPIRTSRQFRNGETLTAER